MISRDHNTPELLKYAILGEDTSTTEEKLGKYTGTVDWKYLCPHYLSGVLYFAYPSLPLAEVGAAFSEDGRERVVAWLKAGDIVKIAEIHAAQWEKGAAEFEALVVSPLVLCRPV